MDERIKEFRDKNDINTRGKRFKKNLGSVAGTAAAVPLAYAKLGLFIPHGVGKVALRTGQGIKGAIKEKQGFTQALMQKRAEVHAKKAAKLYADGLNGEAIHHKKKAEKIMDRAKIVAIQSGKENSLKHIDRKEAANNLLIRKAQEASKNKYGEAGSAGGFKTGFKTMNNRSTRLLNYDI